MPELLTTRLFPKGQGADAYRITGIAARCDWVVLSDTSEPRVHLVRHCPGTPRTVFLSLRSPVPALQHFACNLLPLLTQPFVLVSGSEDVTVPNQQDRRWPPFDAAERALVARILAHPLLRRWHAENLDDCEDPRFTPLPLGRVFADGIVPADPGPPPPTAGRTLRMLCAHRIRDGAQWEPRRQVSALCRGPWRGLCTLMEEEVPEHDFVQEMRRHAFVLCVEGGGFDPSPKAWQAIEHGAIPIVRRTALAPAYTELPVAFVPAWEASAIDAPLFAAWTARFAPAHDVAAARAETLRRLTLDFWWDRIAADLADR
jgi:hypothetical protein